MFTHTKQTAKFAFYAVHINGLKMCQNVKKPCFKRQMVLNKKTTKGSSSANLKGVVFERRIVDFFSSKYVFYFFNFSSSSSRTPSSSTSSSSEGRLFGLNLHLGISNLISGGMNLLGHLRRKTPLSAPTIRLVGQVS